MGMLAPAAITAGGSILGSVLGGKGQQNAAQQAQQAQQDELNTQLQYLQNAGAQARGAVNTMLPYTQGATQAASALRNNIPYLPAGQGATFGGQHIQATPTGGEADYSSLLSPQMTNQLAPPTPPRMIPPSSQMAPTNGNAILRALEGNAPPIRGGG